MGARQPLMAKYSPKSRVGLLAGTGEMSVESSSKISDGRNLDISVCSSIYSGQAGEDCQ